MGIIYCITFPSGKQYIGQTRQKFKIRLLQHKSSNDNTLISRTFNKYKDNFKEEILLEINNSLLDEYEIKFIDVYNTLTPFGYNSRTGGQNGYCFTDEIKLKCSISQRKDKDNKYQYICIIMKMDIGADHLIKKNNILITNIYPKKLIFYWQRNI
jgi:hypothetical protein